MVAKGAKQDQTTSVQVEVEVNRRLNVHGTIFEETQSEGRGVIRLGGDTEKARDMTDEEVGAIVRFFVGFQRRQGRSDDSVQDGRGQVQDPAHDARIKGNEDLRQNDPDRSKQAGRASSNTKVS